MGTHLLIPLHERSSIPGQISMQIEKLIMLMYTSLTSLEATSSSKLPPMQVGWPIRADIQRRDWVGARKNPDIGRRVRKEFEDGGTVGAMDYDLGKRTPDGSHEAMWHVHFTGGDSEDMKYLSSSINFGRWCSMVIKFCVFHPSLVLPCMAFMCLQMILLDLPWLLSMRLPDLHISSPLTLQPAGHPLALCIAHPLPPIHICFCVAGNEVTGRGTSSLGTCTLRQSQRSSVVISTTKG